MNHYDVNEEITHEDPAITAALAWASREDTIDWAKIATLGDMLAESLIILNSHRRRAVRIALLKEHCRQVPDYNIADETEGTTAGQAVAQTVQTVDAILRLAKGKLSTAYYGFITYLSKHPEGAGALRSWFLRLGFSNGEITWLFTEFETINHKFIELFDTSEVIETLLEHTYRGDDMKRVGFLSVDSNEVPEKLANVVTSFASKGVTPSLLHLLPFAAVLVYLADDITEGTTHEAHEQTLYAMIGARGTCYSDRTCSGKKLGGSNITAKSCKSIGGKSLKTTAGCIKV
jgi:hypothetical protein